MTKLSRKEKIDKIKSKVKAGKGKKSPMISKGNPYMKG